MGRSNPVHYLVNMIESQPLYYTAACGANHAHRAVRYRNIDEVTCESCMRTEIYQKDMEKWREPDGQED